MSESGRAQQQQPKVPSRVSECNGNCNCAHLPTEQNKKTVKNEHTAPVIVIEVMTDGVIENWTALEQCVQCFDGQHVLAHTLLKSECTFTRSLSQTPDTSHLLKRKG